MRTLFLVTLKHGPAWDTTRPLREQKDWDPHAKFMDALVDEGFVVLGGPRGDWGALLIVDAADGDAIRRKLDEDPWHHDGHLEIADIERWTVLLHAEQRG